MVLDLSSLPPELIHQTLSYLPISSLHAFGQTNKYHRELSKTAFQKLRISVFPTKVNCMLFLINDLGEDDRDTVHDVQICLSRKQNRKRSLVVHNQNRTISSVLAEQGSNLRDLEVALWSLEEKLAETVGGLKKLRHLSIRMDHPHTRHVDALASFWKSSTPSAAWNSLYSNKANPISPLGRLESLRLERAGVTAYQLRRIMESNPRITELRLRKCSSLDAEFWEWLADSRFASQLKVLHFTHSANEQIDNRILEHLDGFAAGLDELSLFGCPHVDDEELQARNEQWKIPKCTLPSCAAASAPGVPPEYQIVVDPAYK